MIDIKKIAFTKLRKLEVYNLYNDVVRNIREYDTKAMHIGDTCDVLIAMQPKAQLLQNTQRDRGPHILTPEVERLHERRLSFAAVITNQMRTIEKAALADQKHLVELAKPLVYGMLNYLRQNDIIAIESLITEFFYDLNLQPEVRNALYELGFKTYLDELEAANNDCINTQAERAAQKSRRNKGSTTPVQRELQYILSILFEQVDYYQHVYKDVDYSGLITALNYVIATYTKLIKTRDTQRKNKKLRALEEEQAALEEKAKIERFEKNQSAIADDASVTLPIADLETKPKGTPLASTKKKTGKDKPIDGLIDILKKPDKGKKDEDG